MIWLALRARLDLRIGAVCDLLLLPQSPTTMSSIKANFRERRRCSLVCTKRICQTRLRLSFFRVRRRGLHITLKRISAAQKGGLFH